MAVWIHANARSSHAFIRANHCKPIHGKGELGVPRIFPPYGTEFSLTPGRARSTMRPVIPPAG